jgi:L-fucose isomerase-like protein
MASIVTLPNFGDERGIAESLRLADLRVPVLVQATLDNATRMTIADRRDSFCGKMSACNNSAAVRHSVLPYRAPHRSSGLTRIRGGPEWFSAVCRVVNGLRRLRIGAIGARPSASNTVRYSEKILEANGITVEPIDLSEIFGRIERLRDDDACAQSKLSAIQGYVSTAGIPAVVLMKMAKLGLVIDCWMSENDLDISAVQCWTSMEEYFGVVPCTVMSMMSNGLQSSACEVYVPGVVGMHALRWLREPPAHCSIGITITAAIRIKPSASTAATCRSISSARFAWIFRKSSQARWGGSTRSSLAWARQSIAHDVRAHLDR